MTERLDNQTLTELYETLSLRISKLREEVEEHEKQLRVLWAER